MDTEREYPPPIGVSANARICDPHRGTAEWKVTLRSQICNKFTRSHRITRSGPPLVLLADRSIQ